MEWIVTATKKLPVYSETEDLVGYVSVNDHEDDVLLLDVRGNEIGVARSVEAGRRQLLSTGFNDRHYFTKSPRRM